MSYDEGKREIPFLYFPILPCFFLSNLSRSFHVLHTTYLSFSQIFLVLSCITHYPSLFVSNLFRSFPVLRTTHLSFSQIFLVLFLYYILPTCLSLKSFSSFPCITHYPPVFLSNVSSSFRVLHTT